MNQEFIMHHPTYDEYIEFYDNSMKLVTFDSIQNILGDTLKIASFKQFDQSDGVINVLYDIKLIDGQELVLRVHNTHQFWRGFIVHHTTQALKMVKKNTTIPLPEVLMSGKYFENGYGFEYIIFRRVPNSQSLQEVINDTQMETEQKVKQLQTYLEAGLQIVKQLQSIPVPQMIGSFSQEEGELVGFLNDGPRIGPFCSYKEYLIAGVKWALNEEVYLRNQYSGIQGSEQEIFEKYGLMKRSMVQDVQELLEQLKGGRFDTDLLEINRFYLSHNDLNASNILVDRNTKEIKAILDWDASSIFPAINDPRQLFEFFVPEELRQFLEEWYQKQLECIDIVRNKRVFELQAIVSGLGWAYFWVNNWWKGESPQGHKEGMIRNRLKELRDLEVNLKQILTV